VTQETVPAKTTSESPAATTVYVSTTIYVKSSGGRNKIPRRFPLVSAFTALVPDRTSKPNTRLLGTFG
jgi:hypothetical protein